MHDVQASLARGAPSDMVEKDLQPQGGHAVSSGGKGCVAVAYGGLRRWTVVRGPITGGYRTVAARLSAARMLVVSRQGPRQRRPHRDRLRLPGDL
eukprot:scaffold74759_cov69-Phaeocystis_antarctica.AAC.2